MNTLNFVLFQDRHEHPQTKDLSPLYSGFDFSTFKAERAEGWKELLSQFYGTDKVSVYVTGLTPALSEFMADFAKLTMRSQMSALDICEDDVCGTSCLPKAIVKLSLFHYNRETASYVEQVIF